MHSLVKYAQILAKGLYQPHERYAAISLQNYAPTQNILQRCVEFLPILMQARFDPQEQVHMDLCPRCNARSVWLKLTMGTRITRNYGHSGSDVPFSWVPTQEMADSVKAILNCRVVRFTAIN